MNMSIEHAWFIINGIWICLQYTSISIVFGCILGLVLACAQLSSKKWLTIPAKTYISIFRGTPVLVQLSLVYYALPMLIGYNVTAFVAGVLTFSLNSSAYVAEIFRAGIQSIDKGQDEACAVLEINYYLKMKDIIIPQAFRNIYPALTNELICLMKETALVSVIGDADIMRRAHLVAAETYNYFEPLLIAAACYYVLVMIISKISRIIEKKISYA